jgi:hypothetical protein
MLSIIASPAVVRAEVLMPIKSLYVRPAKGFLSVGDIITLGDAEGVNRITGMATGRLKDFVVISNYNGNLIVEEIVNKIYPKLSSPYARMVSMPAMSARVRKKASYSNERYTTP